MAKSLLDAFFPPVCICCGARICEAGMLCSECYGRLRFIEAPFCRICGKPLQVSEDDAVCDECKAENRAFSMSRSAFVYGDVVKDLVLSLKYGDKTDLAFWMARMMSRSIQNFSRAIFFCRPPEGGNPFIIAKYLTIFNNL